MPRRTSTHSVAVVVFVNAEGADAHAAANVGEMAVAHHLAMVDDGRIDVVTRAGERTVGLVNVMELTKARTQRPDPPGGHRHRLQALTCTSLHHQPKEPP